MPWSASDQLQNASPSPFPLQPRKPRPAKCGERTVSLQKRRDNPAANGSSSELRARNPTACEGGLCWLQKQSPEPEAERIALDLHPPCHLLTWQNRPRGPSAIGHDGKPTGDVGQLLTRKYRTGSGTILLVRHRGHFWRRGAHGKSCVLARKARVSPRAEHARHSPPRQ
ncbi:MAG: hypothetical protein JWN04_3567 [Myxococcaceae bacterium]|nr:hypothetical protein [Myxococcaceae bacterium]